MISFPHTTRLVKEVFATVSVTRPEDPVEAIAYHLIYRSPTPPEGIEEVLRKRCIEHLNRQNGLVVVGAHGDVDAIRLRENHVEKCFETVNKLFFRLFAKGIDFESFKSELVEDLQHYYRERKWGYFFYCFSFFRGLPLARRVERALLKTNKMFCDYSFHAEELKLLGKHFNVKIPSYLTPVECLQKGLFHAVYEWAAWYLKDHSDVPLHMLLKKIQGANSVSIVEGHPFYEGIRLLWETHQVKPCGQDDSNIHRASPTRT